MLANFDGMPQSLHQHAAGLIVTVLLFAVMMLISWGATRGHDD
jgi:hypothetical protein